MKKKIESIKSHPLHVSLGVTDISSEGGNAILKAEVTANSLNPSGFYHGGVMYLLLDACAYGGILSALDTNQDAVTHDIHVSVLRPAKLGDLIVYKSKVIKLGRSVCFINVEAKSGDKIIATARVTKSIVSV